MGGPLEGQHDVVQAREHLHVVGLGTRSVANALYGLIPVTSPGAGLPGCHSQLSSPSGSMFIGDIRAQVLSVQG